MGPCNGHEVWARGVGCAARGAWRGWRVADAFGVGAGAGVGVWGVVLRGWVGAGGGCGWGIVEE